MINDNDLKFEYLNDTNIFDVSSKGPSSGISVNPLPGFRISLPGFWISLPGFRIPLPGFWIPLPKFWILKLIKGRIPDYLTWGEMSNLFVSFR